VRKRCNRRPRLIRAPVMKELHDEIAMGMHMAYATLASAPDGNAFNMLASILNMVSLAIDGDSRFPDEARVLQSAVLAMNQIGRKTGALSATQIELLPVRNALGVVDKILPRLDVVKLHLAHTRLPAR